MPHEPQHYMEFEELLQPFVPSVEITKVTLDLKGPSLSTASHADGRVLVRDPHIDVVGTPGLRPVWYDPGRSTPGTGFLDVDTLSRKDRAGIMADIAGHRTMNVKLNLAIKEFSKGGSLTRFSLLDIDEIKQALKIKVVITGDMDSYEQWLGKTTGVGELGVPGPNPPALKMLSYSWSEFADSLGPDGGKQRFEEVEEDGRRVTVFPFEIMLRHGLPSSPNNLGVIVYSYFDINALTDLVALRIPDSAILRPGSSAGEALPSSLEGRRNSLLVIKDGAISSTSYIFKDLRGNIWDGPYHWMTRWSSADRLREELAEMRNTYQCLETVLTKMRTGKFTPERASDGGAEIRCGRVHEVGKVVMSAPSGSKITERMVIGELKLLARRIRNLEDLSQETSSFRESLSEGGAIWMTGPSPDHKEGTQKPLTRSPISTPKVQDFRIFEQVQNLEFDFSIIENNIFSGMKKDLRNNRIDINQSQTYFSDMFLSRDVNDCCRFFFTIDWQRIVVENSIFGNVCKNLSGNIGRPGSQQILDLSPIVSLKLYRSRVEGSGETGSKPIKLSKTAINPPNLKPKVFEENQIDELIITTSDRGGIIDSTTRQNLLAPQDRFYDHTIGESPPHRKSGAPVIMMKSGIKEMTSTDLGFITTPDNHLRHFTGFDSTVVKETDGYYRYRIELEILDKSIQIIENKRIEINGFIDGLKKYYEEATRIIRHPRLIAVASDGSPYLGGHSGEEDHQRGEVKYGNFNPSTNHFTNIFAERYAPVGGGRTLVDIVGNTPPDPLTGVQLKSAILGFISILEFFSKQQRILNLKDTQTALLDYLNPWSATPASINAVIRLMETISAKIGNIIAVVKPSEITWQGGSPEQQNPGRTKTVSEPHIQPKNKTFKIGHTFSALFNANQESYLGFDFLNTTRDGALSPGGNSLVEIRKGAWDNVVTKELAKIWTLDGSNITNLEAGNAQWVGKAVKQNIGVYFTPYRFVLPGGEIVNTHMMPEETFEMPNSSVGNLPNPEFLRPVSYSLYGKRTGGKFLSQIRQQLIFGAAADITPRTAGAATVNDLGKLANDLADYFNEYHDTDIVTPDNIGGQSVYSYVQENVSNRRAHTPEAGSLESTQTDEGYGDEYYRIMRQLSQNKKERGYDFLFSMLKQVQFDSKEKTKIPSLEAPLRLDDWDLALPAAAVRLRLPEPNDPLFPENREILTDAPSQIKSLIYYLPLKSVTPPMFQPRTYTLYDDLNTDVDSIAEFIYKTQVINQIGYLGGYKQGLISTPYDPRQTGNTLAARANGPAQATQTVYLLNSPVWNKTTEVALQSRLGKKLVCRSIPYENQTLAIRRSEPFDLPVYDEYFILDNDPELKIRIQTQRRPTVRRHEP